MLLAAKAICVSFISGTSADDLNEWPEKFKDAINGTTSFINGEFSTEKCQIAT